MNEQEVDEAMNAMIDYINREAEDRAKEIRDKTRDECEEGSFG